MKRYRLSFGLLAVIAFMLGFVYPGYGQQVYTANLSGINEVPAGKSLGTGTVHVVLRGDSIKVYGEFKQLVGNYTASHIHMAAAGQNGSVVFPLDPKVDTDQKGGTYDSLNNKFKLTADEKTALMDGNLYINIHSSDYASGELRGQLFPDGNQAPTASHITVPANGATVVNGGLGTDSLDFKWSKASDPENNPVFYVWQISLLSNFYSVPLEASVGTDSSVTMSKADIDELLQAASVTYGGDMTLYFRIFSTDGSMVTDGPTGSMVFKRDTVLYSIQQAHDAPSGTQVTIKGIVTRAYGAYAYMQDSTAGMTLRQSSGSFADAIANGSVKMGDTLRVSGNVSEYNSLVEINGADLQSYKVLSSNNMLPDPMKITLSDLENNGEMYEARLVRLTGLKVDGSGTFTAATSYKVTDATDKTGNIVLRTPNASDGTITGASIPPDSTVFEGVIGQYSKDNPAAGYQLQAVLATDVYKPAYVQAIHNAPDPAVDSVDVYINGLLTLRNVAYQQATAYMEMPGDRELNIGLAPAHSMGASDTLMNVKTMLTPSENYVVIVDGVLNPGNFEPNPNGISTKLDVLVKPMAHRTAKEKGMIDFFAVHGVPDAPAVDISTQQTGSVVTGVKYNDMTQYFSVPAQTYTISLSEAGSSTPLISYDADLTNYGDTSAVVLASGFLNPEKNQNGPGIKLLVVLPDGTVLKPQIDTPIEKQPGAQVPYSFEVMSNYPNPFNPTTNLRFNLPQSADVRLTVYNILGQRVFDHDLGHMSAGFRKQVTFDASQLSSGVYLYRFTARAASKVYTGMGKMTLIK